MEIDDPNLVEVVAGDIESCGNSKVKIEVPYVVTNIIMRPLVCADSRH